MRCLSIFSFGFWECSHPLCRSFSGSGGGDKNCPELNRKRRRFPWLKKGR
ncbi:hypothetical protein Fmac_027678 [Flemingia macrophylla]|uniref:Uncharacterized protein n=1 Tax=Flemingia macrophylla TaxID=520843 RepID=A0ABD1LIF4_9FABA